MEISKKAITQVVKIPKKQLCFVHKLACNTRITNIIKISFVNSIRGQIFSTRKIVNLSTRKLISLLPLKLSLPTCSEGFFFISIFSQLLITINSQNQKIHQINA